MENSLLLEKVFNEYITLSQFMSLGKLRDGALMFVVATETVFDKSGWKSRSCFHPPYPSDIN